MIEATGYLGGRVTFDGRFVEISRSGPAKLTAGGASKRIPVKHISSISIQKPTIFTNGYIEFTLAGGNEVRSRTGRRARDAARDENCVMFRPGQRRQFEELRRAVEDAMVDA